MKKIVVVLILGALLVSLCTLVTSCIVLIQDGESLSRISRIMLPVLIGGSIIGCVLSVCMGGFLARKDANEEYDLID